MIIETVNSAIFFVNSIERNYMKPVYYFGKNNSDGQADMKNLLGGKGANLAEMAKLGIPVPAGLTITTDVCTYYYENNQTFPKSWKISKLIMVIYLISF